MTEPVNTAAATDATVTAIIVHHPRAEARDEYERWLLEIREACRASPGYLSTDVIRPVGDQSNYTVVIRFSGVQALTAWMESDARHQLLHRIEHALERGDRYEIRSGLDFWFTPPAVKPPVRWKQFLLTLSAIFPLTIAVPWALQPLLGGAGLAGLLGSKLLVATVIVALMVYVIMPPYTRRVAKWLYR